MIAEKKDNRRLNAGNPGELALLHEALEYSNPESSTLESWNVHDRGSKDGFTRWKVCAAPGTSVLGKANYAVCVKDGKLWTKDDGSTLKEDRPALFIIVESLAAGGNAPIESLDETGEEDPFGDAAITRGRKLTQLQHWNRALLQMRMREIHWECRPDKDNLPAGVERAASWEQGIRQAWFGCFRDNWDKTLTAHAKSIAADARLFGTLNVDTGKIKPDWSRAVEKLTVALTSTMPQEMIDDAILFITRRGPGEISFEDYTRILEEFYRGDYKPMACQMLAAQLDVIANIEIAELDSRGVPMDLASIEAAMHAGVDKVILKDLKTPNSILGLL